MMRAIYLAMGITIAAFPFWNFYFRIFRGLSVHFVHSYERVAPFVLTFPQFFQKYIHFYLTDFIFAGLFIGLCFLKKVKIKELFFNRHSRYLTFLSITAFASIAFSIFSRYYFQYSAVVNLSIAFLGFHLVYALYKERTDLIRPTLWAFWSVSLIECLIGGGQFLFQHHLGLQVLSEPPITPFMEDVASVLINREFFHGVLPWVPSGHYQVLRAHGTFDHPNIFGGYLAISLFVSYYLYITSGKRRVLPFIPLQVLVLFLTFSRGSIFAWILSTVLFFTLGLTKKTDTNSFERKKLFQLGSIVGAALIVIFFMLYRYIEQRGGMVSINSQSWQSDQGRLIFYRIALALFLHAPIIGIGYNGFSLFPYETLIPELSGANPKGHLAHNIYLQTGAEMGVIGLSLFLFFIFSLFKPYIKMRFTPLSLTLGIIFLCMCLSGLVDHFWITYTSGRLMFFLFAGFFAAATFHVRNAAVPEASSQSK